jgi:hypothetical protein
MTIYRSVPVKQNSTHNYNLPQDVYSDDKQPTPGQTDIRLLWVYDCPFEEDCVWINGKNITIYCRHLKSCVPAKEGQIICDQTGNSVDKKIILLKTFAYCSISERGCIAPKKNNFEKKRQIICEHLEHITDADSSRPHFQIACGRQGKS